MSSQEKDAKLIKVTEFTGYVSGDGECFCLSKISYEDWLRKQEEVTGEWPDPDLLYPNDFFPEECAPLTSDKRGKFKFKITVEAEQIL